MRPWRVSVVLAVAAACASPYAEESSPGLVPGDDGGAGPDATNESAAMDAGDGGDAEVRRQHVYVVGGQTVSMSGGVNDRPPVTDVTFAEMRSDGALGSWQTAASLDTPSHRLAAVAVDDAVVAMGGEIANNPDAGSLRVQRAGALPDGALAKWIPTADLISPARRDHAVVVVGRRVYAIGGQVGGGASIAGVDVATLGVGGAITAWAEVLAMPQSRARATAVHTTDGST